MQGVNTLNQLMDNNGQPTALGSMYLKGQYTGILPCSASYNKHWLYHVVSYHLLSDCIVYLLSRFYTHYFYNVLRVVRLAIDRIINLFLLVNWRFVNAACVGMTAGLA